MVGFDLMSRSKLHLRTVENADPRSLLEFKCVRPNMKASLMSVFRGGMELGYNL